MTKQLIDVEIDEKNHRIKIVLDEKSNSILQKDAETAGIILEDFAKKIIEDGMRKEIGRGA